MYCEKVFSTSFAVYAAFVNEVVSAGPQSHDFRYKSGGSLYHDFHVGGERFAGEGTI